MLSLPKKQGAFVGEIFTWHRPDKVPPIAGVSVT